MSQVLASSRSLWFLLHFAGLAAAPPGVSDRLCLPPSASAVLCCVAVAEQHVGTARLLSPQSFVNRWVCLISREEKGVVAGYDLSAAFFSAGKVL